MAKKGRDLASVMGSLDEAEKVNVRREPASAAHPDKVVPVNVLMTPGDRHRLKQLSLDTGLSLQKLGHEAWNMLLEKRGLPPLEPVSANVPSGRRR